MNLVIFTLHYPYGYGEVFLEDEIKVAESKFDNILIVSYAKDFEKLNKYVPHNAKVITLRKKGDYVENYFTVMKFLFRFRVWEELLFGCRERGFSKAKGILKQILIAERHVACLQRKEHFWNNRILKEKETIYYSYWLSSAALYMVRNKKSLNRNCISRTHGGDCFFSRGFIPWRKSILQNMDWIFPISESGRLDILVHYGAIINKLSKKISVARLGVELPLFVKKKKHNNNPVTIVSCSNVIPLKRLDLLIDALYLCDFADIHWIHFGDGILMEQVKKQAQQKLSKNNRITYEFFGRVSKKTILDYYSNHVIDIFINCSDVEGIPVSAMEAMSYGIPVIARNVGGNSELIDNKCGILLAPLITPQELSVAIRTVLFGTDGILYQDRSYNAYKRIEEKYFVKKNYNCFFDELKRMITDNE